MPENSQPGKLTSIISLQPDEMVVRISRAVLSGKLNGNERTEVKESAVSHSPTRPFFLAKVTSQSLASSVFPGLSLGDDDSIAWLRSGDGAPLCSMLSVNHQSQLDTPLLTMDKSIMTFRVDKDVDVAQR